MLRRRAQKMKLASMRPHRPRLSYANVMVTVLAFIVLGGGAYAAAIKLPKNSVGTKQIKDKAVTANKLSATGVPGSAITGAVGSATNATNSDHAADSARLGGRDPSAFGAVLMGRMNNLSSSTSAIQFGSPSGTSAPNATLGAVEMESPNQALVARDLAVFVNDTPIVAEGRTFTLMVGGAASSLSCLVDLTATVCQSSGSANVPAHSTLAIRMDNGPNSPDTADALFSFRLTAG